MAGLRVKVAAAVAVDAVPAGVSVIGEGVVGSGSSVGSSVGSTDGSSEGSGVTGRELGV
jgi:hypothetical protein